MIDTQEDFELVRSFINGNENAFNKLVHKYQQKIYWHARKMTGNHLDADEVVQEVLLVLYNKLKDFKFQSSLYTWIYKITSTRSINQINKRKVRRFFSIDDNIKKNIRSSENIIENLETKEKLEKLDKIIQKLPARQREIFLLRNYEGLSYKDIANITGKTIGGLKANYFHAMQKITEMMKKNEDY